MPTTLNARDQPPAEVSDQRVSGLTGAVHQLPKVAKCVPNVVLGFLNEGLPYRVPYPQTTPVQESGPARPIPSGIC
ncbi:phospholipase C3 PlcC [Mycobacterium tuberculosis XTB13-135]|nr:phospholipase C3 PlcC [Mycobacterium tuberculosis XTB13-135]